MRRTHAAPLLVAGMLFSANSLGAGGFYGNLNNFDVVNDTGNECHGFEIELDGVHSTDITYTYDWNHYGPPKIREDNTDPLHPNTFVQYESPKNPDGTWVPGASTLIPTAVLAPTDGHFCTDTSNYSYGCEHFGVGYSRTPTAVKYNWLLDDGAGNLILGPAVNVGTPSFTYYPPPAPALPAQVVAVIPAPVVPIPPAKQFGEPVWVKVIKTTTHNANPVPLKNLVSADADNDGLADWQNGEPDEVESEWKLLQTNSAGNLGKAADEGKPDDAGDGNEVVTRRYEFYQYAADDAALNPAISDGSSVDGENGEAMCANVNVVADPNDPQYLHGIDDTVDGTEVTGANGEPYFVRCADRVLVGAYIGAQMAGFEAFPPLGLIDHLQDGEKDVPYTPRTVVVGGISPVTNITGVLPPGMDFSGEGVLSGTPVGGGDFPLTLDTIDIDHTSASKAYVLHVAGDVVAQYTLSVDKIGTGAGRVSGNASGIDCGNTCTAQLYAGSHVTLTATPDAAGSFFAGWGGACNGFDACVITVNSNTVVTATFSRYRLTVSKLGDGAGTVSGNGIDCGTTCTQFYDFRTPIELTATPAAGSVFNGWGGDCVGSGTCSLSMYDNHAVTAAFASQASSYTLSVTRTGSGTVTSSPKGISCGSTCSKTFKTGTSVTLTAKPSRRHRFLGWTGACSGTALTCTVQMRGNRNVGANFN